MYDEGNRLGTVHGFDEHGVYVTTADGVTALSSEPLTMGRAEQAELMWRCREWGK